MDGLLSGEADARVLLERTAAASAAQMSAENFPVALRLLPSVPRARLQRLYGYARFVDDIGDETGRPGAQRKALLDLVEAEVQGLPEGKARLAVVAALAPLVFDCGVPLVTLTDLIDANRQDQDVSEYADFDALLDYCRLSAAPIGRVVLHVADAAAGPNLAESDRVCAGLQVLEHCQDVGEDVAAGRVYLPANDLAAAGVERADLLASTTSPALRRVIALQVARSRDLLEPGRALVRRLHGWARLAVSGYVAGGLATADALERAHYDVLSQSVTPTKAATARHAARLMVGR